MILDFGSHLSFLLVFWFKENMLINNIEYFRTLFNFESPRATATFALFNFESPRATLQLLHFCELFKFVRYNIIHKTERFF